MKIIALAGNPNSGKTTLFNKLTGLNQYIGNWPGVTVEKKEGLLRKEFGDAVVTDLPGIYSLSPYSPEEVITRDYILREKPDVIINIVDGTNIERNLYLTLSLLEIGCPIVVAINMMDEVNSKGGSIDCAGISDVLKVPVIAISAKSGVNIDKLVQAALTFGGSVDLSDRVYSAEAQYAIARTEGLIREECTANDLPPLWSTIKLLENDLRIFEQLNLSNNKKRIIEGIAVNYESTDKLGDRETMLADLRYRFITANIVNKYVVKPNKPGDITVSDRIDSLLTSRVLALPIFLALLALIFYLTFGPFGSFFSNCLDILINEIILHYVVDLLSNNNAEQWLISLVSDGIIAGVGGVLVFLPQIAILFFFLSLLEDSGYMARAAFIMDKLFRRFGLSGKSFIPLLMGFGCSVPAIMATRTLENERDRRMTIILTPFMSCAARFPVYAVFISAFFEEYRWVVTLGIYFLGIFVAMISGLVLNLTVFKGETVPFVMELPTYRLPTIEGTALQLWDRVKEFLLRAGTLIFAMSIVIWFLSNFGLDFAKADPDRSIFANVGKKIAPIFVPLGFGNWKSSVSLLAGIIAKEAVVSTMCILYAVETGVLVPVIKQVFTPASALSFMTFTLLYIPCISTLAATRREMNSFLWTLFAVIWQLGMSYLFSLLVYNIAFRVF